MPDDLEPISFTVYGLPAPQGSKRYVPTAAGPRAAESNERALRLWRSAVVGEAVAAMDGREPLLGPVSLVVGFSFPRPRAHYRTGRSAGVLKATAPSWAAKRPDLDKLLRAIGDCLTGVVLVDDAQIVDLHARKSYGAPACTLTVTPLLSPQDSRA